MATTSKTKSVSSLNKQLAGVASKAKSLGINTGKADAMVAQTTAQGSKSFKGSSYEKDYQASAIAADGLAPTAPINLPEKPTVPDVGNLVAPGNIGLQSTAEGMYTVDPATGMTTMAAPTDPLAQNQQGRLADMFAAYEGMGSGEADLAKLEKENKLAQKRQAVSNYTGQLNAIVAKSQAEQLGLEGQGRGITESIIGGQQAQINREAAIQALPVQAQLAAAQGDLEMAQQHVDKLFAIKRQDAQALFQFKSNVINSVYDFADKQEQRRLDEVSKIETRKYEEQQDFLKTQRSLLSSALQQGAPSSVVNAINGATTQEEALVAAGEYNGDLLAREAQRANIAQSYASIRASNANAALNEAELAKMNDPTLSTQQNADLAAYAMQFSDTGKLPSVSEMKQAGITASQVMDYAKQVPKPNGALVSTNTGTKSTTLSAEQEKSIAALNEIVTKTLPALKDRFGKINTGIVGGLTGMVWTSQDRQDYLTFRQEFLNKLLVARSGGAVTEQEYSRYADMVPSTFNQPLFLGSDGSKKLNSLETSMKGNLDSVLNTNQLSMYGYSKVDVGGTQRTVGEVLDIGGTQYRVLPDGTLTDVI